MAAITKEPHPALLPLQALFQDIPLFLPIKPEIIDLKALVEEGSSVDFRSTVLKCDQLVQQLLQEGSGLHRGGRRASALQLHSDAGSTISRASRAALPKARSSSVSNAPSIRPDALPTQLNELLDKQIAEYLPFWNKIAREVKEPHKRILLGIFKGIKMMDSTSSEADLDKCLFPGFWIVYCCYFGGYDGALDFILEHVSSQEQLNLLLDLIKKKHDERICRKFPFLNEEQDQEQVMQERMLPLIQKLASSCDEAKLVKAAKAAMSSQREEFKNVFLAYPLVTEKIFIEAIIQEQTELAKSLLETQKISRVTCDEAFIEAAGNGKHQSLKFLSGLSLVSFHGFNSGLIRAAEEGRANTVNLFLLTPSEFDPSTYEEAFSLAAAACSLIPSSPETDTTHEEELKLEEKYASTLSLLITTKQISGENLFASLSKLAASRKMQAIKVFLSKEVPDKVYEIAAKVFLDWQEMLTPALESVLGMEVIQNAICGNLERLKELLQSTEDHQKTLSSAELGQALTSAIRYGFMEVADFLLKYQTPSEIEKNQADLELAIRDRDFDRFSASYSKLRKLLLVDRHEAFVTATSKGRLDLLILLSSEVALPYRTFENAIYHALINGHESILIRLQNYIRPMKPNFEDEILKGMEIFKTAHQNPKIFAENESTVVEMALLKAVEMRDSLSIQTSIEFCLKSPSIREEVFNKAFITTCQKAKLLIANSFLDKKENGGRQVTPQTFKEAIAAANKAIDTVNNARLLVSLLQIHERKTLSEQMKSLSLKEEE